MDSARFDHLTRIVSTVLSRRGLAGALGVAAFALPVLAEAKKRHKHKKKKKIKRNSFGCVDVGKFCKNSGQCCSGICEGKKGKKTCKAHDQSTCQAGQTFEECGGAADVECIPTGANEGTCVTTTGKGAFCAAVAICTPCKTDADCEELCGPQAACVPCAGVCAGDGGTACAGPSDDSCGPPI